jgi:hypothetical protein
MQIYKSIMGYYHLKPLETRSFERLKHLKVDGSFK